MSLSLSLAPGLGGSQGGAAALLNSLTFGGEVLTFGGEQLTFGA